MRGVPGRGRIARVADPGAVPPWLASALHFDADVAASYYG